MAGLDPNSDTAGWLYLVGVFLCALGGGVVGKMVGGDTGIMVGLLVGAGVGLLMLMSGKQSNPKG